MSQSDYINFKKTALILKNNSTAALNELPPVLTPELYTAFTTFNLETTVSNTKNAYSRLLPSGRKQFLDIEKNVSNCSSFILCKNTNTRPNRIKNTFQNPMPIYKWKKTSTYVPNTCSFSSIKNGCINRLKNGHITRRCICINKVCKCKIETYKK